LANKYGEQYGIEGDERTDPLKASLLMGHYFKDTTSHMRKRLGRQLTRGEVYAGNYFGAGGAVQLLKAPTSTPTSRIWGKRSDAILKSNPWLKGMNAGQLRAWLERKVRG
jgi:hypothetical protein